MRTGEIRQSGIQVGNELVFAIRHEGTHRRTSNGSIEYSTGNAPDVPSTLDISAKSIEAPTDQSTSDLIATSSTHPMITGARAGLFKLNPKFGCLILSCTPLKPRSVVSALKYPSWRAAMNDELRALHENQTCESNFNIVGCKWVLRKFGLS